MEERKYVVCYKYGTGENERMYYYGKGLKYLTIDEALNLINHYIEEGAKEEEFEVLAY